MTTNNIEVRASKERGSGYYSSGRYQEAIAAYSFCIENAASEDLELHVYYSNRSASFMQIKDYTRAKEDAESCVSIKPTWAKGYSRLGNSLLKLRKVDSSTNAASPLLLLIAFLMNSLFTASNRQRYKRQSMLSNAVWS